MLIIILFAFWLVAALFVGASGVLAHLPFPPPAVAVGLTIVLLLFVRLSRRARGAVFAMGPRPLVALHLTRIVAGAYFLVLYGRGVLPDEFAIPAGWGDIAVGLAAIPVLWRALPPVTRARRVGLAVWNTAGLIDILGVLGNGMRIFVANPAIGVPFTTLPLALLPTFVVPIVIVSHVLVFGWCRGDRRPH